MCPLIRASNAFSKRQSADVSHITPLKYFPSVCLESAEGGHDSAQMNMIKYDKSRPGHHIVVESMSIFSTQMPFQLISKGLMSPMFTSNKLFLWTSGPPSEWRNPPSISRYSTVIPLGSPLHSGSAGLIWMLPPISETFWTSASKRFWNLPVLHRVNAGMLASKEKFTDIYLLTFFLSYLLRLKTLIWWSFSNSSQYLLS